MVLTPAGEIAVQAIYRVRSVRPRLAVQLPEDAVTDSNPVHINGLPRDFQKGDGQARVIPLVNTNADEPFVLEIRYTVPGRQTLPLPAFPEDTAVQKVYLCAFVPPTQDVVRTAGSWAENFQWRWGDKQRWMPVNDESHERKVEWVCEGNNAALGTAATFPCDGAPLIFSTLRPDAQTGVRLWTLDHQTMSLGVFCVVVLFGVVLAIAAWLRRAIAVALLVASIVAVVLLGLFWPTFSLHVLGWPLFWAVAIVLLFWAVVGLLLLYKPFMAVCAALNTTWSAWIASRKAMAQLASATPAPPPAAHPNEASAAKDGGASHE
jgi:hypothetical protein